MANLTQTLPTAQQAPAYYPAQDLRCFTKGHFEVTYLGTEGGRHIFDVLDLNRPAQAGSKRTYAIRWQPPVGEMDVLNEQSGIHYAVLYDRFDWRCNCPASERGIHCVHRSMAEALEVLHWEEQRCPRCQTRKGSDRPDRLCPRCVEERARIDREIAAAIEEDARFYSGPTLAAAW